jgi:dTDP-4-dehydrorhamnose reductase
MSNNNPILILGASGQIGRHLVKLLGDSCIGLTQHQLDLSNLDNIERVLENYDSAAVFNAAAYTDVDSAENEESQATKINGTAPGIIARWCAKKSIPFVHYSTDYVYSGEGDKPWVEDDIYSPLNAYGRTKVEGDKQVSLSKGRWLIFRVEWIYDSKGKNFLTTILHKAKVHDEIEVAYDQHGSPTYAQHIAAMSIKGLNYAVGLEKFPSGVYNLCNEGVTTRFDFASAILSQAQTQGIKLLAKGIKPVKTAKFHRSAKRPLNSRLNTDKANNILGLRMLSWEIALYECFEVALRHFKDENRNYS